MKKISPFVAILVLLASVFVVKSVRTSTLPNYFNKNVEALTESETVRGHCREIENTCIAECPHCHAHFISDPEKRGPAYDVSGTCPACHQYFHID